MRGLSFYVLLATLAIVASQRPPTTPTKPKHRINNPNKKLKSGFPDGFKPPTPGNTRSLGGGRSRSFLPGNPPTCDDNKDYINWCPKWGIYCNIYQGVRDNCKRSCYLCPDQVQTCTDPWWCLEFGDCSNPYHWESCKLTCNNCDHEPTCTDEQFFCERYTVAQCSLSYVGANCPKKCGTCPPSECSSSCGGGVKYTVEIDTLTQQTYRKYVECNTHDCPIASYCPLGEQSRKFDRRKGCCMTANANECGVPENSGFGQRIIGGTNSFEKEFPWMVGLAHGNKLQCGGAILSANWVITAGHCVSGFNVATFKVIAGVIKIDQAVIDAAPYNVQTKFIHPEFDGIDGDVGLLKMKQPFVMGPTIWPICLPGNEVLDEDMTCIVTGFGAKDKTQLTVSTSDLQKAAVSIMTYDVCRQGYRNDPVFSYVDSKEDSLICAGRVEAEIDSCFGDSGAPLACQKASSCAWFLAGTVSFGPLQKCAEKHIPGMYSKISFYESWVNSIMDNN